jgi:mRNA interferase YafQ
MYRIAWYNSFRKAYKKTINKKPELREKIIETIKMLENDPYQKKLMTHKLHGNLKDFYGCYIDYDNRIVFSIEKIDSENCIALIDIGTHDEVY